MAGDAAHGEPLAFIFFFAVESTTPRDIVLLKIYYR